MVAVVLAAWGGSSPGTARGDVAVQKKGKYNYLCTVPGHAAAGMKGFFTVR